MAITRKAAAIDFYEQGYSSREVAKIVGLSDTYVRDLMRDAGIARPVGRPASLFEPQNDAA